MSNTVIVGGVGMIPFSKPGASPSYTDMGAEAVRLALKDAGITQPMNSAHLESCIGAKVLTEAMRRSKKPGDAKALLASIKGLGTYDTGGFTVNYGADQQHGSKYVELGMVTRDGKLR